MQVEKVTYRGREYALLKSKQGGRNYIEVMPGGVLVVCNRGGYPQIYKRGQHLCEVLTSWDKLNPDNFLCWCD